MPKPKEKEKIKHIKKYKYSYRRIIETGKHFNNYG